MEEEINKIHIRSEELDEILGKSPNWIIRRGMTVLIIVLSIVIAGSVFYKYPEVVQTNVTITTYDVPGYIKSKADGPIDTIFALNNCIVKRDENLALIQNTASYTDVMQVKLYFETISNFFKSYDLSTLHKPEKNNNLILGDIHDTYTTFIGSLESFIFFTSNPYYSGKETNLADQLSKYEAICSKADAEISIKKEQLLIAKRQYERDSVLFLSGTISSSELEKSKSSYLEIKLIYQNSLTSLDNTNITMYQLEQSKLELGSTYEEKYKEFLVKLKSEYDAVCNAIVVWEANFLLKSPVSGKLTFTKFWNKNQNVTVGDTVFAVIPEKTSDLTGIINLSGKGSGKVKPGQTVIIKLDNFPYMEFGSVSAKISNISCVPSNSSYIVEVKFPQGLKTNYGKVLNFTQQMQGSAEIITDDVRLIERFFNPLRSIWNEQTE